MKEIEYDESMLQKMFVELKPERRVRALKSAFRKEANRVKKVAIANLREKVNSNEILERGVRALVFKKKCGFRVTIGTTKEKKNLRDGFYANHYEQKQKKRWPRRVPVLLFTEEGTASRHTSNKIGRGGRYTGSISPPGKFMEKTKNETIGSATENLRNNIVEYIIKTSKKYGCT